jgi:hypothetical protein
MFKIVTKALLFGSIHFANKISSKSTLTQSFNGKSITLPINLEEIGTSNEKRIVGLTNVKFIKFCKALIAYNEYNKANSEYQYLETKFKIPSTSDWPKDLWNYSLGLRVNVHRAGIIYKSPEQIKRIQEIGLPPSYDKFHELALLNCLKTYRSIHQHSNIPKWYVVPNDPRFDKSKY